MALKTLKTLLITQARSGSTRLPGKVLKVVQGKTLLQVHLDRLKKSKIVSDIVVATTTNPNDVVIYEKALGWGFKSYRGSENDVLDRYYQAAKPFNPEWVVRVTSDCPLLDPSLVDDVIQYVQDKQADYGTNTFVERFPDGQDVEVFKFSSLEKAWNEATKQSDREHVTPYIRRNSNQMGGSLFTAASYPCEADFSKVRMTVDEPRDFELVERLILDLGPDRTWKEYTAHIIEKGLGAINQDIIRNAGFLKSLKNDQ